MPDRLDLAARIARHSDPVTFWASLAGLALLLVITAVRVIDDGPARPSALLLEQRVEWLEARVADQAAEIQRLRAALTGPAARDSLGGS